MLANINGTRIFFDIEGLQYVPDGPTMRERPVCFVMHGGPGGEHANFLPECSALTDIMQLVYIDDRNCGRSDRGDLALSSIEQNVEDVEALRKYLGLNKIFLMGHSYGGIKGQLYGIRYHENLHGLILAGTASHADCIRGERVLNHIKEWGTPEQYEMYTHNPLREGKMGYKEYMIAFGSLYHHKFNTPEEQLAAKNGVLRCIKNQDVNVAQSKRDMSDFDFRPDLDKIKCPTLILSGEYDFITDKEAGAEIGELIPGSEYFVVPDAAHEIYSDNFTFTMDHIRTFVNNNFKPE